MLHEALLVLWGSATGPMTENQWTNAAHLNSHEKQVYSRILDIAKMHQAIQHFVDDNSFLSPKMGRGALQTKINESNRQNLYGLYSQALGEAIEQTLQPFRSALVEAERKILANPELNLTFIFSHIEEFRSLFNALNRMTSNINDQRLRGCQLLAVVYQFINTGHQSVRDAMLKIFSRLNRVFYDQLSCWLLYGDLRDVYCEFFIYQTEKTNEISLNTTLATSLNHSKLPSGTNITNADYEINIHMLPNYIHLSMAQDILFVGRTVALFSSDPHHTKSTINLLQIQGNSSRRFTIWGDQEIEFHAMLQGLKNQDIFDMSKFHIVLGDIKSCVTEHLWVLTVKEAHVIEELQLLKDFFLLGRGELFLELLRRTDHILEDPPTPVSTRDMNQEFHVAARSVLLGNNSCMDKFSFDLPYIKADSSFNDSEIIREDGWSTIILKYDVQWPLHLLFTPEVLARYNTMFRLLLRIKNTQHELHLLWYEYKNSRGSGLAQLHNKLMFIMDNLQHYLQADVLETNFSKLLEQVRKTSDFELLKNSHNLFLSDIMSQAFLLMTPLTEDETIHATTDYSANPVLRNIMELLNLCDSFCKMTNTVDDAEEENYHLVSYTSRFETIVAKLLQLLAALRTQPCGTYLARLLMRLDYNRWFSSKANLTQSVTNMLY